MISSIPHTSHMCIGSFFGGTVVDKMISKLVVIDMLSLIYFVRMDLSQQCRIEGAVPVVIAWWLDLQLHMQSVLSPLTLWVRILFRRGVRDTTLWNIVCQWLLEDRWFSPGTPISSVGSGIKDHSHHSMMRDKMISSFGQNISTISCVSTICQGHIIVHRNQRCYVYGGLGNS